MAVNKVVYGDDTLIDLTEDTITENDVLSGATFHSADGEQRTGSVVVAPIDDTTTSSSKVWSSSKVNSELDSWHIIPGDVTKQVITATTTGVQTISFTKTYELYAYKLYANTSDGSLVEVKSSKFELDGGRIATSDGNFDTGTLTYTVDVKLAGTQFALRRTKV